MKKLCWMMMAVVLMVGLIFTSCAQPAPTTPTTPTPPVKAEVIKLKMESPNVPGSGFVEHGMKPWMYSIEWASDGRIDLELYPSSTLFAEKDVIESMVAGLADFARVFTMTQPGRFVMMETPTLPGMGRGLNSEQASEAWWEICQQSPEMMAESPDLKLLGGMMLSGGTVAIPSTVRITTIDDFKGLKWRCWAGAPTQAAIALGGTTMSVPMPDVYLALAKGVVDLYTGSWESYHGFKHYEVAPYVISNLPMGHPLFYFIANEDMWNSLPADLQQKISDAGIFGEPIGKYFGREVWDTWPMYKQWVQELTQEGGYDFEEIRLSEAVLDQVQEIGIEPAWAWYLDKYGDQGAQKVFDLAVSVFDSYRAK